LCSAAGRPTIYFVRTLVWLLLLTAPASAERYIIQPGETVGHAAESHGCSTDYVERLNHLDTSIVRPGTVIDVPNCRKRSIANANANANDSDEARARAALAVIDGATWVTPEPVKPRIAPVYGPPDLRSARDESLGAPWQGALAHPAKLEAGDGYIVKRPSRAFGAKHVVAQLRAAIGEVHALYPEVHTLAIGDLSA